MKITFPFLLFTLFLSVSCHKDPALTPVSPGYIIPVTYNGFNNVDHSESTTILGMLTEMSAEISKGTSTAPATAPNPLNRAHLANLFQNQNNEFASNASYNNSGFQIKSNCLASAQALLESYLDTLVAVSNEGTEAGSGVAGLGLSEDATPRRFLLTSNGVNYAQVFNKVAMGALIYNQIASRVTNTTLDNTTQLTGPDGIKKYTALEHNWDEAFGYWSVPDSFPIVKKPVKFWGSYSNQVDSGLHCNKTVMNAFLKGRAAISNKDLVTVQAQADIILAQFDVMIAGAVCQELNEVQQAANAGDIVKVCSAMSECKAFVISMQFNKNPKRTITDEQINTLLGYFPVNFWEATQTDLNKIRSYINGIYGFTAAQSLIL